MRRFALALIGLLFVVDLLVAAQLWRAWQDRSRLQSADATSQVRMNCLPGVAALPDRAANCR